MIDQRRGQRTKDKILEEACNVFAAKGYRDATLAEICRQAGTNIAAVNYYFESKEALYRSVFELLTERAQSLYPTDGGLQPTASPEERLRVFVRAFLGRMFDTDGLAGLHRIRMAEMFDPTGLLEEPLRRRLAQDRGLILGLLRELMGPGVEQRDVEWCELSIIGQCMMAAPGHDGKGPRVLFGLGVQDVDRLAEHILTFSLAGLEAIRRNRLGRTEDSPAASNAPKE